MCGIFGFIGKGKNPKVTYDLATSLFLKTEHRGTDATGFYATQPGEGCILLDKEPVKATDYIERDIWKRTFLENDDVDMFIGHCRQTSVGGGPERINKNNHPHWSDDRRIAVTHNGKIPEFSALKHRYDVGSECDSEILLRMFESAQIIKKDKEEELKKDFPNLTPFLSERLLGLKEIFSRVNYGAMAVAIAERGDDGQRFLWLFRDDERPLYVIDMREQLGQIFYCSTPEIWRNAVEMTPSMKNYLQPEFIIEFPPLQVWLLGLDPSKAVNEEGEPGDCWNIKKFKITKTKYIDWKETEDEDDKLSYKRSSEVKSTPPKVSVVSRLGKNDEVIQLPKKEVNTEPDDLDVTVIGPDNKEIIATAPKDKKKIDSNTGGDRIHRRSGLTSPPKSAQVIVNGRVPGDETEERLSNRSANDHKPKNDILKGQVIVGDPHSEEEEKIDLDAFDKIMDEIDKLHDRIKVEVHNKAQENSMLPMDFSRVLDSLMLMRQEATNTVGLLTEK